MDTNNNDLMTVAEVAKLVDKSRQAVYKQLTNSLQPYVVKVDNKTMLKKSVLTEYFKINLSTKFSKKTTNVDNRSQPDCQPLSTELNSILDVLKGQLEVKDEQLEAKDEQMRNKDEQIAKLTDQIIAISTNLAKLQENSQTLQLEMIKNDKLKTTEVLEKVEEEVVVEVVEVEEIEENEIVTETKFKEKPKKGFLSRFFGV